MFELFQPSYFFDIAIVSLCIYLLVIFVKQTRSYSIFYALILLILLNVLSDVFDLGLTRKIIEPIITFFLVIFVIVFQREIRRFFKWIVVSRGQFESRGAHLDNVIVSYLSTALTDMAKKRIGAIVVLSGEYPLDDIVEGGFELDGRITAPLLFSIFDDSTPGHDGAVLIENRRISKFGVHLPLAENFKGFSTMGTRHRAACGITERTDAMALVVSEERGTVSVAQGGTLLSVPDKKSLEDIIAKFMKTEHAPAESHWWNVFVTNHFFLKVLSIALASALWFIFIFQANISTKDIVVPFEFQRVPEGLQVSRVMPTSATITVSGANQDIQNIKESDIRVVLNLRDRAEGSFDIALTNADIVKPAYVDVIKISPVKVGVTLELPPPKEEPVVIPLP